MVALHIVMDRGEEVETLRAATRPESPLLFDDPNRMRDSGPGSFQVSPLSIDAYPLVRIPQCRDPLKAGPSTRDVFSERFAISAQGRSSTRSFTDSPGARSAVDARTFGKHHAYAGRPESRSRRPTAVELLMPAPCYPAISPFRNRTEHLSFPPDWNRGGLPRLWAYHLHYHEFLWALPFADARRVVLHWIAQHRCAPGQVGWEPYPISVRIATWCTLFFGLHRAQMAADQQFNSTLSTSIHEQAETLHRRLEWHLLGNHLFENAVALAVAGSCFTHPRAAHWLRAGVGILRRQLPEQILPDGGHFERSPMYHARILHALRVLEATRHPVLRDLVRPYAEPAARWLSHVTHPDGCLAQFNDSTLHCSVARPLLATGPFRLAHAGYYGARNRVRSLCDLRPPAPSARTISRVHAHADLFSFELSLHGAPRDRRHRRAHVRARTLALILPVHESAQYPGNRRARPSRGVVGVSCRTALPSA